jgi:hypothetical protein
VDKRSRDRGAVNRHCVPVVQHARVAAQPCLAVQHAHLAVRVTISWPTRYLIPAHVSLPGTTFRQPPHRLRCTWRARSRRWDQLGQQTRGFRPTPCQPRCRRGSARGSLPGRHRPNLASGAAGRLGPLRPGDLGYLGAQHCLGVFSQITAADGYQGIQQSFDGLPDPLRDPAQVLLNLDSREVD